MSINRVFKIRLSNNHLKNDSDIKTDFFCYFCLYRYVTVYDISTLLQYGLLVKNKFYINISYILLIRNDSYKRHQPSQLDTNELFCIP